MNPELDKNTAQLTDTSAPWVVRRDAADFLGETAKKALHILNVHRTDPDMNVRMTVEKALSQIGQEEMKPSHAYSLEELAQACESPNERSVTSYEQGYRIEVRLPENRRRHVFLRSAEMKGKACFFRAFTYCGTAASLSFAWVLRTNMSLPHGALALVGEEDKARYVLTRCFAAETVTPEEMVRGVAEMAYHGDLIERKIMELNEL